MLIPRRSCPPQRRLSEVQSRSDTQISEDIARVRSERRAEVSQRRQSEQEQRASEARVFRRKLSSLSGLESKASVRE